MQKRKYLILLLFLLLSSLAIKAQEVWTLEQCIKYAFDNNIQIKQQMLYVKSNEGNLLQSKLGLLPNLNANGNQSFNFDRSIVFGTNQPSNEDLKSTSVSLSANVSLFKGLQKYNLVKQYEFDLMATASDVEKIKNSVALSVASAYLQILYSEELLATSNRQVELSKLQVEKTGILVKAGSIPEGNLLEIEAQLASDELQLVNAQNQLDLAYLSLTQLLEIKKTEGFKIQKPTLDKFEEKLVELSPNGVFEAAQESMPQIKSANFRVLSAQKKLWIAKGGMSPSLTLNGYYGSTAEKVLKSGITQTPFFDQLKKNVSKSITFNLSIPIFNGWSVKNNISNAKISLDNAKLSFENEKNVLYKDIQQAYTDALAAQKKLKATQKNLVALTESFRYSEQKFNVGLVTSIDYTTAKTKLSKAETDLLQAKYELIFKSKILEFYKGVPLSL
jgi:outer membrane protein